VLSLFANSTRVQSVELDPVVLKFVSHSAARKTFEGYNSWEQFPAVWMNVDREEMGDVTRPIPKTKTDITELPTLPEPDPDRFRYQLFTPDDDNHSGFCLPVIALSKTTSEDVDLPSAAECLGHDLFDHIFNEDMSPSAAEFIPI
jgi:hypothetical protein